MIGVGTTESTRTSELNPTDSESVLEVANGLAAWGSGEIDHPEWVAAARQAFEALPVAVRRQVRDFRRNSGPAGALLLRGLPVVANRTPPTPNVAGSVQRAATVPAAILVSIACGLGDPAAYRPEKTGALVQDVVPVPGMETFQGNAGSAPLTFHNENAFHDHRPSYVLLLCLRADHERVAMLRTACIRELRPYLSDDTVQALFREEFSTAAPPSFGGSPGAPAPVHAVLTGAPDDPDLRVDMAATKPLTERAAEAMARLGEAFDERANDIRLVPGDLAIVDNRVTVHGRSGFMPRYDGEDRWLQRTFALADLRRSRSLRPADSYVLVG